MDRQDISLIHDSLSANANPMGWRCCVWNNQMHAIFCACGGASEVASAAQVVVAAVG
jgi:hypothetical protein